MSEARAIRRNMMKLGFVTPNLAERAARRRARNAARYAAARSAAVTVARGLNVASRGLQLTRGSSRLWMCKWLMFRSPPLLFFTF